MPSFKNSIKNIASEYLPSIGTALLIIAAVVLLYCIWSWLAEYYTRPQEGFQVAQVFFGNQLNKPVTATANITRTNPILELPGNFKLTGLSIKPVDATKDKDKKVVIYIAANKGDIQTQTSRQPLTNPSDNTTQFSVDGDYKDVNIFETSTGTAKYVGGCLLFDKAGLDYAEKGLIVTVYGLAPYALSSGDYEKMPEISSPTLSINMPKTGLPEILVEFTKNYKVGWLEIKPETSSVDANDKIVIRYSNGFDNRTNIYTIEGPYMLNFVNSKDTTKPVRIYFDEPIIASLIRVEGALLSTTTSVPSSVTIKAYGVLSVARDEVNFKLQRQKFDTKGIVIEGQKCPNAGEMMNKQLQAQLICESLEYKDRERNKRLAYEKDKVYLKKLEDQEREIRELEGTIGSLIKRKNARIEASTAGTDIDELSVLLDKAERARTEANQYLADKSAKRNAVNFKVNLDPQFKEVVNKLTANQ